MANKAKSPSRSPSDDLVPRSMLPDRPTIPEWQSFGYGAPAPKPRVPPTVKKKRVGGHIKKMAVGGISAGPGVDPNAPVQGSFGTPYMPSVPVQQRQLGGTPGLVPPTPPNMGIAPGAIGGNPSNELPTVPVQPRQPMGRARPMPVPVRRPMPMPARRRGMNEGGAVKKYAAGGSISSASRRADGIAKKGKTRGKMR